MKDYLKRMPSWLLLGLGFPPFVVSFLMLMFGIAELGTKGNEMNLATLLLPLVASIFTGFGAEYLLSKIYRPRMMMQSRLSRFGIKGPNTHDRKSLQRWWLENRQAFDEKLTESRTSADQFSNELNSKLKEKLQPTDESFLNIITHLKWAVCEYHELKSLKNFFTSQFPADNSEELDEMTMGEEPEAPTLTELTDVFTFSQLIEKGHFDVLEGLAETPGFIKGQIIHSITNQLGLAFRGGDLSTRGIYEHYGDIMADLCEFLHYAAINPEASNFSIIWKAEGDYWLAHVHTTDQGRHLLIDTTIGASPWDPSYFLVRT